MQFSHLTPVPFFFLRRCFYLLFPRCFFILSRCSDSGEKKGKGRRGRRILERKEGREEKGERQKKEGISKELSLRPVIRADATLIILLFDGIRARGDFVVASRWGQSGLVAASNEKVASVPVKIARLAMNTINSILPSNIVHHSL